MINKEFSGLGDLHKEIVSTPRGDRIKYLLDRPSENASPLARTERRDLDYFNHDPVCRDIEPMEFPLPTSILVDDERGGFAFANMTIVQFASHQALEGRWRRRSFYNCKGRRPKTKDQIEDYVAANAYRGFIFCGTGYFYDCHQFFEKTAGY